MCAAGALVEILTKEGLLAFSSSGWAEGSQEILKIRSLAEVSLEGFLTVDQASYSALQIFHVSLHAVHDLAHIQGNHTDCISTKKIDKCCCSTNA